MANFSSVYGQGCPYKREAETPPAHGKPFPFTSVTAIIALRLPGGVGRSNLLSLTQGGERGYIWAGRRLPPIDESNRSR